MEQDDAFHLTAVDVRRYEFQTVMRGYDRMRVDQFKDQVADEMERLMRANQDLDEKARNFHEQLRAFRERDRALNEALVSAQQLRADMKAQASGEADLIVHEAQAQAARVLEDARAEAHRMLEQARDGAASLRLEIEQLDRARRGYLAQMRALAERHIAEATAFDQQRAFADGR
jgi:DivIVA domain-containing protein